jgi:DUF4097 and DUF4098 domain-containing protein YvlB
MKKIKFAGIFLLTLTYSTCLMAQDKITVPLSNPGQPYQLDVRLVHGSITVSSYEGSEVIIESSGGKNGEPVISNGFRKISPSGISSITADESSNKISVRSSSPGTARDLMIRVPQKSGIIKLSTVNSGGITVNNVSAELEVNNINGSIKLVDVSGSVVAATVNGSINVSFKTADPKAAMAFSTLNGNIDVAFPATIKANIRARTDQGTIQTDFDLKLSPSKVTSLPTQNGFSRLKSDEWLTSTVNGGGQDIMLKTTNGNITIRKAK